MPYKVKLESFEGPLDLLLYLIKKEEVDIYDIPIARITGQYQEYLEIIQLLDLESASDFILMAATLMRIKSKLLLPKPELDEDEEEYGDPREELVHRLLEYKRFKDVAEEFKEIEDKERLQYPRGRYKFIDDGIDYSDNGGDQASIFDLIAAFRKLLVEQKRPPVHRVEEISVSLEERVQYIQTRLGDKRKIEFSKLFKKKDSKIVWVVTFIAILELMKQRWLKAEQEIPFEKIFLIRMNA